MRSRGREGYLPGRARQDARQRLRRLSLQWPKLDVSFELSRRQRLQRCSLLCRPVLPQGRKRRGLLERGRVPERILRRWRLLRLGLRWPMRAMRCEGSARDLPGRDGESRGQAATLRERRLELRGHLRRHRDERVQLSERGDVVRFGRLRGWLCHGRGEVRRRGGLRLRERELRALCLRRIRLPDELRERRRLRRIGELRGRRVQGDAYAWRLVLRGGRVRIGLLRGWGLL